MYGISADHRAMVGNGFRNGRSEAWLAVLPIATCENGLDDDGDALFDFADPDCGPEWPYWEVKPRCGVGAELVLVLAPLAWLRRRHR